MNDKLKLSYLVQNFGVFIILLSYMKVDRVFGIGLACGVLPIIYRYWFLKLKPDFFFMLPIKTLPYILIYVFCVFLSAFMIKDNGIAWQGAVDTANYIRPFFLILFLANNNKEFYYGALIAIIVASFNWVFLSGNNLIAYFMHNKNVNLGPFENQNSYVFYINLLMPFIFANILNSKIHIKILCIIATIYLLVANFTTISRGGIIAFCFMFLIYIFIILKNYKKRILFIFSFVILAILLVYFSNIKVINRIEHTSGTQDIERIVLWKSSIRMIEDHLLYGVGINNFNKEYRTKYISPLAKNKDLAKSHNMWLTSLAETGIVGAIGLFILMYHFITFSFKNWNNKGDYKFNLAIFLALSGMLLHTLVDDIWIDQYVRIFWCLWAVAICEATFCASKEKIGPNNYYEVK